jgi:hypothetical protein
MAAKEMSQSLLKFENGGAALVVLYDRCLLISWANARQQGAAMKRDSRTVDRSHQVDTPRQHHLPLVDLLVDTRAEPMALAVASGLNVLRMMLEEELLLTPVALTHIRGSDSFSLQVELE